MNPSQFQIFQIYIEMWIRRKRFSYTNNYYDWKYVSSQLISKKFHLFYTVL